MLGGFSCQKEGCRLKRAVRIFGGKGLEDKLRFMDAMRIYAGDWRQALSQMKGEERRFDLVFLDPPYRMPVLEECCAALADLGLLEADALLVLEHRLDAVPSPDGRFALWKDRAYGDTAIHFFHYRESV